MRTVVQRALPDRLLVSVFGLQEAAMMAGLALGVLLAPLLVGLLGAQAAFAVAGLFLPVVVLAASSRLRRIDDDAEVPTAELALLQGVPSLAMLPPRILERLAREVRTANFPAAAPVVIEGEPGDLFYVIRTGEVTVRQHGELLRTLGAGDWFGEIALLRDVPRTATVTSVGELTVGTLARESFLEAVTGVPRSLGLATDHARHYLS
jgi:MFS family permease